MTIGVFSYGPISFFQWSHEVGVPTRVIPQTIWHLLLRRPFPVISHGIEITWGNRINVWGYRKSDQIDPCEVHFCIFCGETEWHVYFHASKFCFQFSLHYITNVPLLCGAIIRTIITEFMTLSLLRKESRNSIIQNWHCVFNSQYHRYFQHAHFIPIVGVGKRSAY